MCERCVCGVCVFVCVYVVCVCVYVCVYVCLCMCMCVCVHKHVTRCASFSVLKYKYMPFSTDPAL